MKPTQSRYSWNQCKYPECENWTSRPDGDYCESHRRSVSKEAETSRKQSEKREQQLKKAKHKSQQPRKTISKNPADWSNTFLCSDGTRVTQAEINERLKKAYETKYPSGKKYICEGCMLVYAGHNAHIIPQARCKHIGKTELIWNPNNFFRADHECNAAIENPKGKAWKALKNIFTCLMFIKIHDPELYTKFELSAVNQEHEPHKI